ncbi:MAG: low molecular weight phosphotyrosine protein phosphatase [Spirochaetales bacterium]|nr:low molecular weight phosphotyrosine protein phosphatase [Spirochaetales bacterium]
MKKYRIMFVCLGNICRSPLAHGIFEQLLKDADLDHAVEVESSGTSGFHRGEKPDPRMTGVAAGHGVSLDHLRSQQFVKEDLERFDLILPMDLENHDHIKRLASHKDQLTKVKLFRDYDPDGKGLEVPDPYYGGPSGFEKVFSIADRTCRSLLRDVKPLVS